jgi:hypothetical protein
MYTLPEAQHLPTVQVGTETRLLAAHTDLLPAAFVVPAAYEEGYYRHNNLPSQLSAIFAPVRPQRIDEDTLEPLCVQAAALIRGSALLDDSVQSLYRALQRTGLDTGTLHVRRPGERAVQTVQARPPGTEVLYAFKRLWADDWRFESVLERLDTAGSVALEARPVLVVRGPAGVPDAALAGSIGAKRAWANAEGLVGLE